MTARLSAIPSYRRKYERRKADGICTNCTEPAVPGLTTCEKHRNKNRKKGGKIKPFGYWVCPDGKEGICWFTSDFLTNEYEEKNNTALYSREDLWALLEKMDFVKLLEGTTFSIDSGDVWGFDTAMDYSQVNTEIRKKVLASLNEKEAGK